jgi:hypothetical protein
MDDIGGTEAPRKTTKARCQATDRTTPTRSEPFPGSLCLRASVVNHFTAAPEHSSSTIGLRLAAVDGDRRGQLTESLSDPPQPG